MKKHLNITKYSQYLPSKKFGITLGIILIIIIPLLFFFNSKEKPIATKEQNTVALQIENKTINDLIAKDSDGDGIADWEEEMWGTDKNNKMTFDGIPDTTYIENKKSELNLEKDITQTKLTETEKFAREFFTGFVAMKSSGEVDADTMNSFSNALGQKIVDPTLIDIYSEKNLKIDTRATSNSVESNQRYYAAVQALFQKYQY